VSKVQIILILIKKARIFLAFNKIMILLLPTQQ
jgi:hypothetical protein